jgi:hypothetical protein
MGLRGGIVKKLLFFLLASFLTFSPLAFSASDATHFDTDTKLMLHCDGADLSTTFTDSSSSPKSMTANGGAIISTLQSKFGGASGLLVSATSSYLSTGNTADFNFGTGDFTIDFWFRFTSNVGNQTMVSLGDALSASGLEIKYNGSLTIYFATAAVFNTGWTATDGTWYHYAITRNGTNLRQFINGTQEGTTVTNSTDMQTASAVNAIGRSVYYSSNYFNGYLDEIRVVKGTAVWTANFTPPTAAYIPPPVTTGNFFQMFD